MGWKKTMRGMFVSLFAGTPQTWLPFWPDFSGIHGIPRDPHRHAALVQNSQMSDDHFAVHVRCARGTDPVQDVSEPAWCIAMLSLESH